MVYGFLSHLRILFVKKLKPRDNPFLISELVLQTRRPIANSYGAAVGESAKIHRGPVRCGEDVDIRSNAIRLLPVKMLWARAFGIKKKRKKDKMGCSVSSIPPLCFKNKGGWSPCIICVDQSYTIRNAVLFNCLSGITDLVWLVESFISLDCSHIPSWYLYGGKEFYQGKPRAVFGHVVWNYYASQHKGVALYAIVKGTYRDAIWVDETRLKLQILAFYFKSTRHPNCLRGFRAILKDKSLSSSQLVFISSHLNFWIKQITLKINTSSTVDFELGGFYPLIWILFIFLLRSEDVLLCVKIKIVNFLVKDLYFCWSIREIWTNLAGEFLEAFSSPPLYRYKTFMKILGEE